MSKLQEAITTYNDARERMLALKNNFYQKNLEIDACRIHETKLLDEADALEARLRSARTTLKNAAAVIGPLLHSDVSGICGASADREGDQPSLDDVPAAESTP